MKPDQYPKEVFVLVEMIVILVEMTVDRMKLNLSYGRKRVMSLRMG